MTRWWERVIDALVLVAVLAYTLVNRSYIASMWILQRNFFIALRCG